MGGAGGMRGYKPEGYFFEKKGEDGGGRVGGEGTRCGIHGHEHLRHSSTRTCSDIRNSNL